MAFSSSYNIVYLRLFLWILNTSSAKEQQNATETKDSEDALHFRLPKDLIPKHYVLKLDPNFEDFSTRGSVEVTFEVINPTNKIILHMADIKTINETLKITSLESESMVISKQSFDPKREFYIICLADELQKERLYNLYVEFIGTIKEKLLGFYKLRFTDSEGKQRWGGATQFQSTSARSVFPCFDEPEMKATFDFTIIRDTAMVSLSNMPLKKSIKRSDTTVQDYFERTVPMSTYLLAFVIGDFVPKEISNPDIQTDLKIWATKELISEVEFAAEFAGEAIIYLEKYFALKFPLPKLDIVAVSQLGPNAMENWGLIISRESGLLHVPDKGSNEHMYWVAYLTAHELAHQWFGNIVTMKWWTDLWLNEGFATYIGYRVVSEVKPSWEFMNSFVVSCLQRVMKLDELKSAPAVRIVVHHPDEIRSIFGKISYLKGGSILRMINHFLGEKTFRKGLNLYLREMKYENAEQDDLWYYLTEAADMDETLPPGVNVKEIMDTWTLQSGFPVIHVTKSNATLNLTQSQFLLNTTGEVDFQKKRWWVPITWVTQGNLTFDDTLPKLWLHAHQITIDIMDEISDEEWILLNPKQNGYYRTNYDEENWKKIIRQLALNHDEIHVINRANLIDDSMNLARAGLLSYETTMDLLSYLAKEKHPVPWMAAFNNFARLDAILIHTSHYGAFRDFLLSLISPMYEYLMSKENVEVVQQSLKETMTKWACYLGHSTCVASAVEFVDKWRKNIVNDSKELDEICSAISEGDSAVWDFVWQKYQESTSGNRKGALEKALGCSKEVWILIRYLEAAIHPNGGIERQDAPKIFEIVASNPIGFYIAWNYAKEHWLQIKYYIGDVMFVLPKLMEAMTSNFGTEQLKAELLQFQETYRGNLGAAETTLQQAIEQTESNVSWIKTNMAAIVSWLQRNGFSSSLIIEET